MIKWDSGKFFPKIGKLLTPTIQDKNVTYFNSSLKVWIERKHAIDFISVKNYMKGLVFKLAKELSQ